MRTSISQLWRLMVQTLPFRLVDKNCGKDDIQVKWVLLFKADRAVGSVTWLATVLWDLFGAIKKGLISRQVVAIEKGKLLFKIISMFLVISLAVLDFEVVAYLQGWHFGNTNLHIPHISYLKCCSKWLMLHGWRFILTANFHAPVQALSKFCFVLFLIEFVDRRLLCLQCFWIKFK